MVIYNNTNNRTNLDEEHPEESIYCTGTSNISYKRPFELQLSHNGNLKIIDGNKSEIW